ncbi:transcriptional regulator [Mangrovibacter phragmitis]|uniref:Transcriptional regulator n=1 Tax=Mangrovibacter phragmitis TaxID=1691903 RepID=A0A1B7L1F1_9ENTR|nr:LacI family DNA-binding transcriptional regulator [Mangrovibacter phragmitis]OAT76232.1 transcriptional regulator [Mangrovibacter phragmitis]
MVKMLDVAKAAGVSKSTVSRVLNGKDIVSDEIKRLVFKAIEETGYRPNLLAQQLATQKTRLVGFVMTNALYNGPYFSTLIYGAATWSEQYQHQLIFADGKHSAEDETAAIDYLVRMKCAGIMVYPQYLTPDKLDAIIDASPVPVIVLNRTLPRHPECAISVLHYQCARMMMAFILDMGHRNIAWISGRNGSPTNIMRYQAYLDALSEQGLTPEPALAVAGDWSMESGYAAARQLIEQAVPFSLILAGNDDMALGAMKALQEAGIAVPGDISVAGFDDSRIGGFVSPALTTIKIPLTDMVKLAVERLLGISPHTDKSCVSLPGELVIRDSVKNLN